MDATKIEAACERRVMISVVGLRYLLLGIDFGAKYPEVRAGVRFPRSSCEATLTPSRVVWFAARDYRIVLSRYSSSV